MLIEKHKSKFLPKSYQLFQTVNRFMRERDSKLAGIFNRYMWRYRLARSFKGIDADEEMTARTIRGYSEGMRLFLAYTAYDEIRQTEYRINRASYLIGHQIRSDIELSTQIRALPELREAIEISHAVNKPDLKTAILAFYRHRNPNLMPIATAIRHMFAHGDMTVGSFGLTNEKKRQLIRKLSNLMLDKAEEISDKMLRQYIQENWQNPKTHGKGGRAILKLNKAS
jgi:hypothetical protein